MYLVLFLLTVVLQAVCLPFYIDFRFDKIPYKLQKMICSTLFLLAGVFAFMYAGKPTAYPILICVAFVMSWIGDLVLSSSSKGAQFIVGLLSFLIAHVLFVTAFCVAGNRAYSAKYVTIYEIAAAVLIVISFYIVSLKIKLELGEMLVPVLIYAAAISMMLVKAVSVGVSAIVSGGGHAYLILCLMSAAALLFVCSDATLAVIIFKNKQNQKTELINIATYYIAQMIFAASIMLLS